MGCEPNEAPRAVKSKAARNFEILNWLPPLLTVVLLGVIATNGLVAWRQQAASANVRCKSPQFDFGLAFAGDVVEHEFVVENAGITPLKIAFINTSCGCVSLVDELEGQIIPPEGSMDIRVRLNVKGDIVLFHKVECPLILSGFFLIDSGVVKMIAYSFHRNHLRRRLWIEQ